MGSFGNVRGICICKCVEESEELYIEWRCGPEYDEGDSFVSKHDDEEVIALYVQDRDTSNCSWIEFITTMKDTVLSFISNVRYAPNGTSFVNWKRANEYEETSDNFMNINDEDKWYITLAQLNDPSMAHQYGSPSDAYPMWALLTLYSICVNCHGFDSFPIMVTNVNEQLFNVADDMCRQVSGGSGRTGYGNIIGFERIVQKIMKDYPPKKAKIDYNVWKGGYIHAQALMLVLSSEFEQAMWDYNMVDDPERVENLVGNFLRVFGSYMQPACAPSDAAKEQLNDDLDFNDQHLKAGVFVSDAKNDHEELFSSTFALCVKDGCMV